MHESPSYTHIDHGHLASNEAAYWQRVADVADQHSYVEATMRAQTGSMQAMARVAFYLGHRMESDSLKKRAFDIIRSSDDASGAAYASAALYEISHDPEARTTAYGALGRISPLEISGVTSVVAQRMNDVPLAMGIADAAQRAFALTTIALKEGSKSVAYEQACAQALAQRRWSLLARLTRMHKDTSHLRAINLDAIADINTWLDIAIGAHHAKDKEIMRTARGAIDAFHAKNPTSMRLTRGINERIAEDGLPFLAFLQDRPVLQADALLHLPPHARKAAHYRRIRKLLRRPGSSLSRAAAAVQLAEQSNDADDITFAQQLSETLVSLDDAEVVANLRERLIVLRGAIEEVYPDVLPVNRPRVVAAIAQRRADPDLMHAAEATAHRLEDPLDRARGLYAVAVLAVDHALAAEAINGAYFHDKITAYTMAESSLTTSLTQLTTAKTIQELSRDASTPTADTPLWRQRMAALGSLSAYTGQDRVETHVAESLSPTMTDYILGAAVKAHGAVQSLEQDQALAKYVRERLARRLQTRQGSVVGTIQLAKAFMYCKDSAALNMLYQRATLETAMGRRIVHQLIGYRSHRAMVRAEEFVFESGQPWRQRAMLLGSLAPSYGDQDMYQAPSMTELSPESLLDTVSYVRERYGVTLDSHTLVWLLDHMTTVSCQSAQDAMRAVDTFYDNTQRFYEEICCEESSESLMCYLRESEYARTIFYLHTAGRTVYRDTPAFTPRRFQRFIAGTSRYLIDEALWAKFAQDTKLPLAAQTALRQGKPLVSQSSWDIAPRSVPDDLELPLRRMFAECSRYITEEADDYDTAMALMTSVFGEVAVSLCGDDAQSIDTRQLMRALTTAAPRLAHRVVQYRNTLRSRKADPELVQAWTRYAQQVRALSLAQLPQAMAGFMRQDPTYLLSAKQPDPIAELLLLHLESYARPRHARIRVRLLDKKDDLMQYSRFADATNNCYQSLNIDKPRNSRAAYFDRIWSDPCMFAVQLEATDQRQEPCGFVFGTVGRFDGKPALILNGVYLQKPDDITARAVIESMRTHVADPLGLHTLVFAARNGGTFRPSEDAYDATGYQFSRYSAVREGGKLVTKTFDDLGENVNREPDTAPEGSWYLRW